MNVRPATEDDLEGYAAIQQDEWGEPMAASRAQLATRFAIFPRGQLVAEIDGELVAGASFVRLASYDIGDQLPWRELTADGWCTNHVPGGPVLFGVDLSVSRRAPRSASSHMFHATLELTMRLGAGHLYWGSRLPRYHRHSAEMTPTEYLLARNARGRYLDPEVEMYSRIPGIEILGVVPGYFDDWASGDFGAICCWRNPIHRLPFLRPFSSQIRAAVYDLDRRRRRQLRR